jgi:hypothetical protein
MRHRRGFIARQHKARRTAMKALLFATTCLAAAAAFGTRAEAQNYPWCAEYGGGDMGGGGTNCGFATFEQCMATLSGMGGFCNKNTQYIPPPGPHPGATVRPRHRKRHVHP